MRLFILTLATASLLSPAEAAHARQDDCKYEAQRSTTLDAAGIRQLDLEAGAGFLKIQGKPGQTSVVLRGRACASSQSRLDDIKLDARRDGGSVLVKANIHDDDSNRRLWENNQYSRLDLTIEVPAGMDAIIDDGSGEIELDGLGAVQLEDGSGEIDASNLKSISIEDGSGEITLTDIDGAVEIEDGSGEISLRNIAGAIDIDDGSGEITVRGARASVVISDASGSIDVSDVTGDFTVKDDGSGSIDYDNVKGRVDIPRRRR